MTQDNQTKQPSSLLAVLKAKGKSLDDVKNTSSKGSGVLAPHKDLIEQAMACDVSNGEICLLLDGLRTDGKTTVGATFRNFIQKHYLGKFRANSPDLPEAEKDWEGTVKPRILAAIAAEQAEAEAKAKAEAKAEAEAVPAKGKGKK